MSDAVNASAPEKLSGRIAALERRVALGQQASHKAKELEQSIEALNIRLIGCRAQIEQGDHAQRILDHLSETAERIIAGGETISVAEVAAKSAEVEKAQATVAGVDLPEPHESDKPFEPAPPPEPQPQAVAEPDAASAKPAPPSECEEAPPAPSTQHPSGPHVSQYQQMLNHIATLEPTESFDKDGLASKLGFVAGSIRKYLYRAEAEGHIVKYVVGEAKEPNIYRRRTAPAVEVSSAEHQDPLPQPRPTAPSVEPKQASKVEVVKPVAAPEQRESRDIPPLTARAAVASDLMCEQVLGVLLNRGRPMSLSMVINRARGLKQDEVQAALEQLRIKEKAELDRFGFWKAVI